MVHAPEGQKRKQSKKDGRKEDGWVKGALKVARGHHTKRFTSEVVKSRTSVSWHVRDETKRS